MEQNLKEIQETVEGHTTAIQENGNNIADHEERIKSIEKVIKDNKLAEYSGEFPPLVNFAEKLTSQEQNTTKLNKTIQQQAEDKEEETRKASKALNLIIYGIPENETDEVHQMKQDFLMIKQVYENKVTIDTTDFTQIIRIGKIKVKVKLVPSKSPVLVQTSKRKFSQTINSSELKETNIMFVNAGQTQVNTSM